MKNQYIQIRISEADKETLACVAEARDVPMSQIVRDAVKEKVAELSREKTDTKEIALDK